MALSYSLELETSLSPDDLLRIAAQDPTLSWYEDKLVGPGLLIRASLQDNPDDEPILEIYHKHFGFKPSAGIYFRIKYRSLKEGRLADITMIRICMNVLTQQKCNCALLFNGEIIVFQSLSGEITFNHTMLNPWIKTEIRKLKIPYQLKTLDSPLL
jgi:hypothetical protein